MIGFYRYFIVLAVTAAAMPAVLAQQAGRPVSSDPEAIVPPARYEQVFRDYVPYSEQKIAAWRDINDEAARIGGHVGSLRQSGFRSNAHKGMSHPGPVAPDAPSPAEPAMPGHSAGHK